MKRIILRWQVSYLLMSLILILIFAVLLTACGDVFHESCGVTCASPPPQPQATATPGDRQASISWDAVNGVTYNIYWSITSGVTIANGTKISNVTSPYPHTGLTNGVTYYYIVTIVVSCVCYDSCKGCMDDGDEISSNQASATPSSSGGGGLG